MNDLEPDFAAGCRRLLADLGAGGKEYKPFCTLRHPAIQARLWRQSRTSHQIDKACKTLHNAGAAWLAELLDGVGSQYGPWATNALPGQSWHQHGLALDVYRVDGRKADWSVEAYKDFAFASRALGYTAGYFWRRKDAVHIQANPGSVMTSFSWRDLDKLMQNQFEPAS